MKVYCADAQPDFMQAYQLPGDRGIILGTLFARSRNADDESLASHPTILDAETRHILDSEGRQLIRAYWGNYVAFLTDAARGRRWILKDPTGSLPCLRVESQGVHIFFSSIEDCIAIRLSRFTINWTYVSNFITGGWTNGEISTLNELDEIGRGECIEIDQSSNHITRKILYWRPSDFVSSSKEMESPQFASTTLRRSIHHCVRSLASCHRNLVISLSGGLDSSIVLGCLNRSQVTTNTAITCITYYGTNPGADPRPWARMAAAHADRDHIEVPANAAQASLEPLLDAAPTSAPVWLPGYYLANRAYGEILNQRAATAIFTGEGGDSGFGSLSIGRAIDESLQRRGFGLHTFRLAASIAVYRDSTMTRVLIDALKRRAFGTHMRDNRQLFENLGQLVTPHLRTSATNHKYFPHPWLKELPGAPWGLINRLGSLLMRPEFYDPFLAAEQPQAARIHPLQAQPVVEANLSIPLETHFLGGRDRGLARTAFIPDVPEKILSRQWKDRGQTSMEELVSRNITLLRELMLDGALVREGLLDRQAVDQALSPTPTKSPGNISVLLHYLQAELWIHKWEKLGLCRTS